MGERIPASCCAPAWSRTGRCSPGRGRIVADSVPAPSRRVREQGQGAVPCRRGGRRSPAPPSGAVAPPLDAPGPGGRTRPETDHMPSVRADDNYDSFTGTWARLGRAGARSGASERRDHRDISRPSEPRCDCHLARPLHAERGRHFAGTCAARVRPPAPGCVSRPPIHRPGYGGEIRAYAPGAWKAFDIQHRGEACCAASTGRSGPRAIIRW